MKSIPRATLTQLHFLLAAFMFPVALMFLVTGGLYTWGVKGSYVSSTFDIPVDAPIQPEQASLEILMRDLLEQRHITLPSGTPSLRKVGTSFQLEWTGSNRDVLLEPTEDPLVARLSVKETTWYRNFVQLHKAKGGMLFKVYAAALAIALFLMLATGFLLAWQVPRFRNQSVGVAVAGLLLFAIMVVAS
jgi:uncharacterized iron-regulated membrane protein